MVVHIDVRGAPWGHAPRVSGLSSKAVYLGEYRGLSHVNEEQLPAANPARNRRKALGSSRVSVSMARQTEVGRTTRIGGRKR